MKKILLATAICLFAIPALAQQAVSPCTKTTDTFGTTSCVPVTATSPLPVTGSGTSTPTPNTGTGKYVAKTVTSASTQMLAAGVATKFLQIKNESTTATIACNLGGVAALNTAGNISLSPGWTATWDSSFIPSDAINCISSAATSPATFGAD